MHIYAFGSICRGEISFESDVDLLALVEEKKEQLNPEQYSIYSYSRIDELWESGNPFAWHLSLESKLIFSDNGDDYLKKIGAPKRYRHFEADFCKFNKLLNDAISNILNQSNSYVFELSNIFLSVRNLAICYSLYRFDNPTFSRHAALCIGQDSLVLPPSIYKMLEQARILCTRGAGLNISISELDKIKPYFEYLRCWAMSLKNEGGLYERIS